VGSTPQRTPVRPPAAYIGGKRKLAKRIIEKIDAIPHDTYAEAFVGMGGVFFRRNAVPKAEVINDYNQDVATFFRVLQRHYQAFIDMLRWQITTRSEFERLKRIDPDTLTDLERSARFYYLQRTSFGGKVAGRNFGVSPTEPGRFNLINLVPILEDVHQRLAGVTIERLPYHEFLPRYDRPGTLFYCDPPYWGSENDYGPGMFSRDEFERLATILGSLQGRFILSINDRPEVRAIFGSFELEPVGLTYTVGGGAPVQARELIITGGRSQT